MESARSHKVWMGISHSVFLTILLVKGHQNQITKHHSYKMEGALVSTLQIMDNVYALCEVITADEGWVDT